MDKWLEYWQQDKLHPDVFTDKYGNKHPALQQFWNQHFNELASGSSVLDIACGAGAVYRCIDDISEYDAHALDISKDALAKLKADLPSVHTHDTRLDSNTLLGAEFDAIVSQFGIEYLGMDGFAQIPRMLKTGGKCIFLSHIRDGVIDRVTQQSLNGLTLIQDTKFLLLAEQVADAFKKDDKNLVEQKVAAFMQVEPQVAQYCSSHPSGHHLHLYEGVKELLSKYNQYGYQAIVDWINNANIQALENIERLTSMHNAALCIEGIEKLSAMLLEIGVKIIKHEPFHIRAEDAPGAWEIVGVKQR
jgi:SAM-dependent methyltransferase